MELPHSMDAARRPLVAVVGPTGSGKSTLALHLCNLLDGEIINCDSIQLYKYFDIGAAKDPPELRQGIAHHLIDVLNPDEVFTAGEYARRARMVLDEVSGRGKLPVVVGGTGFYLRALIDGLFPGPGRDEGIRQRLANREQSKPGSLHRLLSRLDPPSAKQIHANDIPKTIRALEVRLLTGRPLSDWFAEQRDALEGYRTFKIGLSPDRDALYERLNERLVRMFEAGLADEVRGILARGYSPECKPFESLGYRQAVQLVKGELNLHNALFYAQRDTRNYAKRQLTWFRSDPAVVWLRGFGDDPGVQESALGRVRDFLAGE
jgi:tRNA dimethylallyltransferase